MTGSFVPHLAIWLHWNGKFSIFSSFPSSFSLLHRFALSHMEGLPPAPLKFLVLLFLLPVTSLHIFLLLCSFRSALAASWLGSWFPPWWLPKFSFSYDASNLSPSWTWVLEALTSVQFLWVWLWWVDSENLDSGDDVFNRKRDTKNLEVDLSR